MHAQTRAGHVIDVGQFGPHVVGVEHRVPGRIRYALPAKSQDVGQGLHHHQEVAVEGLNASDGLSRFLKGQGSVGIFYRNHAGQEGSQKGFAAYGSAPRTSAAVRGGEGFVEVQMDHVKAHIPRPYDAHNGV